MNIFRKFLYTSDQATAPIGITLDEYDIYRIRSELEPYKQEITEILSFDNENDLRFQHFIHGFFPNSKLHESKTESMQRTLHNHPMSNLMILNDPKYTMPNVLLKEFPGLFIIAYGDPSLKLLEKNFKDLWEIVFERYVRVDDILKKIIIFKNRYQIPKFTDINDEIYYHLNEFIYRKYISIRTTGIDYYDIIQLAYYWSDRGPGTKVSEILAINAGSGTRELAISKLLFPSAKLYLTDIKGIPPYVEELSARDAIIKYSHCDLMITCYPNSISKGYTDILKNFKGKYIMYIGDAECNPENFDEELDEWGHSDIILKIDSRIFENHLIVYRRRAPASELEKNKEDE